LQKSAKHPRGQPSRDRGDRKQWLSFNAREDRWAAWRWVLQSRCTAGRASAGRRCLTNSSSGVFATWQAERAVGDHDRNTLRLRLDPIADADVFEPGMTVWFHR